MNPDTNEQRGIKLLDTLKLDGLIFPTENQTACRKHVTDKQKKPQKQ